MARISYLKAENEVEERDNSLRAISIKVEDEKWETGMRVGSESRAQTVDGLLDEHRVSVNGSLSFSPSRP